jgi:hypothetical protein
VANEQVYLTIITGFGGVTSFLSGIVLLIMMNFVKNTESKFTKLFERMNCEEQVRKVEAQRTSDKFDATDKELERIGKHLYKVADDFMKHIFPKKDGNGD